MEFLVPGEGIEPSWYRYRWILNPDVTYEDNTDVVTLK